MMNGELVKVGLPVEVTLWLAKPVFVHVTVSPAVIEKEYKVVGVGPKKLSPMLMMCVAPRAPGANKRARSNRHARSEWGNDMVRMSFRPD